jgi:hypothetical protein
MSLDFTNRLFRLRGKYNIAQQNSDYDIIKLEDVSENNLTVERKKEDEVTINDEIKNKSLVECIQETEIKDNEKTHNIANTKSNNLIKIIKYKGELFRLILLTLSKIMDYVLYRVRNN